MSTATSETQTAISDSMQSEMNHLKRKSLRRSASLGPDDGNREAPSKRLRVEDEPTQSLDAEGDKNQDGDLRGNNGDVPVEDAPPLTQETQSPTTTTTDPRPAEVAASGAAAVAGEMSASPEYERRPSDARRRGSSPYRRSPQQERRRPSDARRRDYSPHGLREGYTSARRGSTSQRGDAPPAFGGGDKERNRRGSGSVVNREEEKKRGRRLFGGLLNTLSQTTSNTQLKRRQEIEKRQHEKAAHQKVEIDKHRSERLAKLERIRKIEQVRFDEQVMRTRHSNALAMAHNLKTRTEPALYYRPWELTREQEDIIREQIRDTEAQIEAELQQAKGRKEQRLRDLGAQPSSSEVEATVGEPVARDAPHHAAQDESAATITNDRKPSPSSPVSAPALAPEQAPAPAPASQKNTGSHEDRDHDEMVEAEEDTVIY